MTVLMAACLHRNPLHRNRLLAWFRTIDSRYGPPAFVAVEANRTLFTVVERRQRELFISAAQSDDMFKDIDIVLLQDLSKAIAYEADTHHEVFGPATETIWLDDVRPDIESLCDPCTLGRRFLEECRRALAASKILITPCLRSHQLFEAIDHLAVKDHNAHKSRRAASAEPLFARDKAWLQLLRRRGCLCPSDGYGIIAVGEDHAQDEPNFLRFLLGRDGHTCDVHILRHERDGPH